MPRRKEYPWRIGSQNDRLFRHLATGKTLTRYEAAFIFHVQNVTARISDLRRELGDSLRVTKKYDPNGQLYAEYRLLGH